MKTQAKKPTLQTSPRESGKVDWLAVAIHQVGGINGASKKFEVTPDTIVRWLKRGVGTLPFYRVVEIADASQLPVGLFCQRTGPFPGAPNQIP